MVFVAIALGGERVLIAAKSIASGYTKLWQQRARVWARKQSQRGCESHRRWKAIRVYKCQKLSTKEIWCETASQ